MPLSDYYPQSMDARMVWHANFYDQLKNHGFATKYGIDGGTVDALLAITTWFEYWVPLRHSLDAYSQQVTGYFNTTAGKNEDADPPSQPTYSPVGTIPPDVPPGIEKFTRDIAKQIKNSTIYAPADGEAMGIETPEPTPLNPNEMQPVFKAVTREAFEVGVTFKKLGMSAVRFEYRHKGGGAWLPAGVIITSPGSFAVAPEIPGQPEQIELRAIYMQGNNNVGLWSDIVPVLIAP